MTKDGTTIEIDKDLVHQLAQVSEKTANQTIGL